MRGFFLGAAARDGGLPPYAYAVRAVQHGGLLRAALLARTRNGAAWQFDNWHDARLAEPRCR